MNPGDVFACWDMYGKKWHVWLMLRPCTDEDVRVYPSDVQLFDYGVGEFGVYWVYVNLEAGSPRITIDNVITDKWELM